MSVREFRVREGEIDPWASCCLAGGPIVAPWREDPDARLHKLLLLPALDAPRWVEHDERDRPLDVWYLAPAHGRIVTWDRDGDVVAFDPGSGAVLWRYSTRTPPLSGSPDLAIVELSGGRVFTTRSVWYGEEDELLTTVLTADGTSEFVVGFPLGVPGYSGVMNARPVACGERVYLGISLRRGFVAHDGVVVAVEAAQHDVAWHQFFPTEAQAARTRDPASGPVALVPVGPTELVVCAASRETAVVTIGALAAPDGAVLWEESWEATKRERWNDGRPIVVAGRVVSTRRPTPDSAVLVAADPRSGQRAWRLALEAPTTVPPQALPRDRCAIPDGHAVVAVRVANGRAAWKRTLDSEVSEMLRVGDRLAVMTQTRTVLLATDKGTPLAEVPLADTPGESRLISDGARIVVASAHALVELAAAG